MAPISARPMKKEFVIRWRKLERYLVRLYWSESESNRRHVWTDFAIFEIHGFDVRSDEPLFGDDFHPSPTDDDACLTGFVKWDGCQQVYAADATKFGPWLHVDDAASIFPMFKAIREARLQALIAMGQEPS